MASESRRVLVVGGGAGGVVTVAALLRQAERDRTDVDVTIVERSAVIGPGLAYGTREPHHLLNNYAARMSALEDDPLHLVRWCRSQGMAVSGETFVSRETYGRYLAALLDDVAVPSGSRLTRLRDEVVDVTDAGTEYLATTASGAVLTADVVVLALGNPPPRRPRGIRVDDDRFAANPWDPALLDRVGPEDRVLLVGTGLTTVDVAAQIAAARPGVRITATSRHGLLPLRHALVAPGLAPSFDGDIRSLRGVLGEVRRCLAEGSDWRCLVESVKAIGNDVWRSLSFEDKEQFTRHVSRYWEISRHRMAPAMGRDHRRPARDRSADGGPLARGRHGGVRPGRQLHRPRARQLDRLEPARRQPRGQGDALAGSRSASAWTSTPTVRSSTPTAWVRPGCSRSGRPDGVSSGRSPPSPTSAARPSTSRGTSAPRRPSGPPSWSARHSRRRHVAARHRVGHRQPLE